MLRRALSVLAALVAVISLVTSVNTQEPSKAEAASVAALDLVSLSVDAVARTTADEKAYCQTEASQIIWGYPALKGPNGHLRPDIGGATIYYRQSPSQNEGDRRWCTFLKVGTGSDDQARPTFVKIGSYDCGGGNLRWYYEDSGDMKIATDGVALTPGNGRAVIMKYGRRDHGNRYTRTIRPSHCN